MASSTITFSSTQTSATVSVTIVDDDVLEDVEQFTVEVVATGGQERVDVGGAARIYISNDDCKIPNTSAMLLNILLCFLHALPACLPACSFLYLCIAFTIHLSVSLSVSHQENLTGLLPKNNSEHNVLACSGPSSGVYDREVIHI